MTDHHYTPADDVIQATTGQGFGWLDNIYGDGGNDTAYLGDGVIFVSGPGNDKLWGSGRSQYATWFANSSVRINLAEGWAQDGYGGLDELHGISNIHLTSKGGEVIGSSADESVMVFGGTVNLDMGLGNDVVNMYQLNSRNYSIRQNGTVVTIKGVGTNVVMQGVESIQFSDATFTPVFKTSIAMLPMKQLNKFTDSQRSEGWWYAGVYNQPQLVSYGANVSVPLDVNADGDLDVIVPMSRGYRSGVDTRYSFQVFENIEGNLTYSPSLTAKTPFVAGARRSDHFLLKRSNSEVYVTVAHDTAIEAENRYDIPWRFGDLTFTSLKTFEVVTKDLVTNTETWSSNKTNRFSAVDAHSLAVGDINGDGMDDVLVGDFGGVFALLQTESGPFKRQTSPLLNSLNGWVDPTLSGATPGLLIDMGMGDLNGDGLDDLVVGWGHATVISRVFFNDRNSGFTSGNSVALPASVYGATNSLHLKTWIEDLDGDGDNDLMILQSRYEPYYGGNYLQLLINDGKGYLTDETAIRLGDPSKNPDTFGSRLQWTDFWQVIDLNQDGALDITGIHPATGRPFYYLNDGHGKFSVVEVTMDQNSQILSWGDFDHDGKVESLNFNSYPADGNTATTNVFSTYEMTTLTPPASGRAFDLSGNAGIVAKVIGAVFGASSIANQNYVGIGLSLMDSGMTYERLLDLALDARLGADRSNNSIVATLYKNLVGYSPSQDDINYFSNLISSGQYSQVSLAKFASDLNLNSQNIDLVGLSQYGLDYLSVS